MRQPENISLRHRDYSPDWWTPPEWWDWISRTLGAPIHQIYDPCPAAWSPDDGDGLACDWGDVAYCNHPGSRRSGQAWWRKYIEEQIRHQGRMRFVWCQFNVEAIRQLDPWPFFVSGWLIWPRNRISFIWGGETIEEKHDKTGKIIRKQRVHGQPSVAPGNCAVFWTNVPPATPPCDCAIFRTS